MITCNWNSQTGWQRPRLEPYGPLSLMPTASVLHYATECFEGMKLYRGYDGRLRLFRPSQNTRRMLRSAKRIALPSFDPDQLEMLIHRLSAVDGERWLPKCRPGTFLYIRPTMIATAASLAVQKPPEVLLYIIACFFPPLHELAKGSISPMMASPTLSAPTEHAAPSGMKLLASRDDMVRAWPGGFGSAKIGANYGPSLLAQAEAQERGYDQVLWLLGDKCAVTEAGASNFFIVWRTSAGRTELRTPPLDDGIILDGITRRSVLDLAKERMAADVDVVEGGFCMDDLIEAEREGNFLEAFVAGTAVLCSCKIDMERFSTDECVVLHHTRSSHPLSRQRYTHSSGRGCECFARPLHRFRRQDLARRHQVRKGTTSMGRGG